MERALDVLVVEGEPGAAADAVDALGAAGHRVHRCFDPGDTDYPCRGMTTPGTCPLHGPIDAVLTVRGWAGWRPTALEEGALCGVRAGLPLVAQAPQGLGFFRAWADRCADDDVVAACEAAAEDSLEPLRAEVMLRIDRLTTAAGLRGRVQCRIEPVWPNLIIHLDVDAPVETSLANALAVRALDAARCLRSSRPGTTVGDIDVRVHPPMPVGTSGGR